MRWSAMTHGDGQHVIDADDLAPEEEPSVGERLRAAREAQPLSLAQIAAELRIEAKFLEALENDQLETFAAPVFAKGYLKQYGGLLGLDERDLLAQYYRQVDTRVAPVLQHKPIRLRNESQIRHWFAAGIVLTILGGAAVVWWMTQPSAGPVVVETTAGELLPATPALVEPAPAIEPAAEPGAPARATVPAAEPPIATVEGPPSADQTIGPGPPGTVVELAFVEDCWTEISDARGERLFYGLGSAGARSRFSATLPISIFFGNAGGVELSVNGDPYPIPPGSRQGNLARFVIAQPGL